MSDQNERLALARKIAERKVGFIRHGITYLVVIAALCLINNLTWGGYQWWLWPALGWGIGVVSHFLSAYLYQSGRLVDDLAKKELEKMNESSKQ
ncbi:MAG TPA: 2TM domain-containing protein [Spirochaetia bacterium]